MKLRQSARGNFFKFDEQPIVTGSSKAPFDRAGIQVFALLRPRPMTCSQQTTFSLSVNNKNHSFQQTKTEGTVLKLVTSFNAIHFFEYVKVNRLKLMTTEPCQLVKK